MRNALRCCVLALMAGAFFPPSVTAVAAPSKEARFSALDYRFDGPEQLPAGQTTVRLKNNGKKPHQLQFLKLEEGRSPEDLAAALKSGSRSVPAWAKQMGGPNGVDPG